MIPLSNKHLLGLVALSLATTTATAQSLLSQYGETVLAVGDNAPGIPGATIFATSNFDAPLLDQNGTLVFRARLTGAVTALDDRAYFLGRANGDLQSVVRGGDPAPGLPGIFLRSATSTVGLSGQPRISAYGEILYFQSTISDAPGGSTVTSANDTAQFWGPVGGLTLLAREGDTVPFVAVNPPAYGNLSFTAANNTMNESGNVLFATQLVGGDVTIGTNDYAVVTGTPGSLQIVVRKGDTLPGGEVVVPVSGSTVLSFIYQINAAGQVLHEMKFAAGPGGVGINNDRALAVWTPGMGDTIIAREGQQAPGLPTGVLFQDTVSSPGWSPGLSSNSFNRFGSTAFTTVLEGGGAVAGVDGFAVYYGGPLSGLTPVFRQGDPAPGLPGVTWGVAANASVQCNDAGDVCCVAFLGGAATTADDSCLVVGSFANPGIVAREGDLVPGMAATVNGPWRYGPFSAGSGTPFLNGRGQLLFPNTVTDSVVQRDMWFGYDPTLGIQIVLDGTDTFTTGAGSGVWTSVTTQSTPNSGDASPPWFNNNGDFAIRVLVPSPVSALIVRGHIGSLIAEPSSVPITGNVPQNFHIDCGVAQAGKLFLVLATGSGTRPGFVSPFGGQQVPLNPIDLTFNTDLWFNLSLNNSNSIVWPGTLGFLDGNGRNINPASFVMPPGFPVFQGVTLHHAVVAFDITFGLQTTFASEASAVKLY